MPLAPATTKPQAGASRLGRWLPGGTHANVYRVSVPGAEIGPGSHRRRRFRPWRLRGGCEPDPARAWSPYPPTSRVRGASAAPPGTCPGASDIRRADRFFAGEFAHPRAEVVASAPSILFGRATVRPGNRSTVRSPLRSGSEMNNP